MAGLASSQTHAAGLSLPLFLQQSKTDIHSKFVDLEWQQRNRLLQGEQQALNLPIPAASGPDAAISPPTISHYARLTGDDITARNRYANVEPFAQNRIKLRVKSGLNDYINASPIQLGKRRYIATQGPKDTSVNHFYRMLAAEIGDQPGVVVMLTQTHEAGREKCFQYYPLSPADSILSIPEDAEADGGDGFRGEVKLLQVEDNVRARCEVRRMALKTSTRSASALSEGHDGGGGQDDTAQAMNPSNALATQPSDPTRLTQIQNITHLLFSAWPDFLVPEGEDRMALITLIQLSAALNNLARPPSSSSSSTAPSRSSSHNPFATSATVPRIIHCSAGVGRTGTFIALDYLLHALHAGELDVMRPPDRDPIVEVVDALRMQRMMMVQSEQQFLFLYEVMGELWLERATRGR